MTGPAYITPTVHLRKGETPSGLPVVTAELVLDPFDAATPLPDGDRGKTGEPGTYQPPLTFQAFIDDDADLPGDLDTDHTGWAYGNTTTRDIHVWDGGGWITFDGVLAEDGDIGPGNELTVTSADSTRPASGGASITGGGPQNLHLTLPIGDKGVPGDAGPRVPLRQSEDYLQPPTEAESADPLANQVLGWTGLWTPLDPLTMRGPYTLGEADFTEVTEPNADDWRLVAQIVIPGQPWPWRPMCFGGVAVDANSGSTTSSMTRADLEVRIGSDEGPMVALGAGVNSMRQVVNRVMPHFDGEIVPEAQQGTVQAGESVTLVLVLRRIFGPREWTHIRARGSLVVYMSPV